MAKRRLHNWKSGDRLSAQNLGAGVPSVNEVLRMFPWVLDKLRQVDPFIAQLERIESSIFPGKITGTTGVATNQWTYNITEQRKTAQGYGGWSDLNGGRVVVARNTIENMNTGSGIEGNGVDHDGSAFTSTNFQMMPAPAGVIVFVHQINFTPSDAPPLPTDPPLSPESEYWFEYENADDGTCSE